MVLLVLRFIWYDHYNFLKEEISPNCIVGLKGFVHIETIGLVFFFANLLESFPCNNDERFYTYIITQLGTYSPVKCITAD